MIILNLPDELTELCLQFHLPKKVIIPANWAQIITFLEEKHELIEKQLSFVQQEINEHTIRIKENFQNKKEPLLKNELQSRKVVNPLAIYSRMPSLTILNYQYKIQKMCQTLEESLYEDYRYLEQKRIEYNELINLEDSLVHIHQYNQTLEEFQVYYTILNEDNNAYVYFVKDIMLVFSSQGIFCFYTRKDNDSVKVIRTDNEENKETKYRYTIINRLNQFFSTILGETDYALIHMYRLDQVENFHDYQESLTPEKIELLKEYCHREGKNLVF